ISSEQINNSGSLGLYHPAQIRSTQTNPIKLTVLHIRLLARDQSKQYNIAIISAKLRRRKQSDISRLSVCPQL
ncbi:uncharacterized protein METZ01_LOCUS455348, partial [marine metagenome]